MKEYLTKYYLIQGYKKEKDPKYHCHIYPNYFTEYNVGEGFFLQSGFRDALKFEYKTDAEEYLEKAKNTFKDYEFDIVPFDSRIFGKISPLYVR